ncbi:MAG: peroxin [Sporothrix thermara]
MFAATRQWFRRHRTPIAVGVSLVGAGYVATQYVMAKLNDARERMSSDRIAKENLRRRFEQNQEDCTFTVLALLPTVTTNILEAMNTEAITYQIQSMKTGGGAAAARSVRSEGANSISPPSIADTLVTEDEGRSMASLQSESGVHASQVALPAQAPTSNPAPVTAPEGSETQQGPPKPRKTKRQLWDELTISSITRAYTLLYTVSLLVMLTRIQLNLLGRRSYLSSVVSLATGSAQATISLENNDDDSLLQQQHALGNSVDFEVNRKYLAFSWWLLNRSWADLSQRVETAVRTVFGHLSPRDLVSLDNFADLTRQVRQLVERGPIEPSAVAATSTASSQQPRWLPLVLPPPGLEDFVLRESGILADSATATFEHIDQSEAEGAAASFSSPPSAPATDASPAQTAALRRMLDETADLVESPTFSHVLAQILDAGFATLLERKVAPVAFDLPPSVGEGSLELTRLRHEKVVQLPKILSVLTRQAHMIGSGMPNEYLHEMESVRDLEAFAAVVYSSNWESEIHEEGLMAAAEEVRQQAVDKQQAERASTTDSQPSATLVEESIVMVEQSQVSLESAWERALDNKA